MNKIMTTLLAISLPFAVHATDTQQAPPPHQENVRYGATKISNENGTDLTVYGSATILSSTFSGTVQIMGALLAEDSTFGNLNINGAAKLKKSTVENLLDV